MGTQLKHDIREYMRTHPGTKYTEARNAVLSESKEPKLGGSMSGLIRTLIEGGAPPVSAAEVRTGDFVKSGDRFGLILESGTTLLEDGEVVSLKDFDNPEFYKAGSDTSFSFDTACEYALRLITDDGDDSTIQWDAEHGIPLYLLQRGDVIKIGDEYGVYDGGEHLNLLGKEIPLRHVDEATAEVFRAKVTRSAHKAPYMSVSQYVGDGDISQRWKATESSSHFGVPLGTTPEGRVFGVNMSATRNGGTGPHGIIQGRTGSGYSMLCRNTILMLAADNSPDRVNIALAAPFGEAMFRGLDKLPHVVHISSTEFGANSVGENVQFDGFGQYLEEEIARRENVVRTDYSDKKISDLPKLVVIVCDFGNCESVLHVPYLDSIKHMLSRGTALGIHVILFRQSFDSTISASGLLDHIGYGVSLSAGTVSSSRIVLKGNPDAARLPIGKGDGIAAFQDSRGAEICQNFRIFSNENDESDDLIQRIVDASVQLAD